MTRDSLRPFENQLMVFTGRLVDVSRPRDGIRCHLLTTVRCWAWDGDSPVSFKRRPDAAVDHTWLRIAVEEQPSTELLERVEGVATVGWYARADGSADLGLRSRHALNLDDVLARIYEARGTAPRPWLIDQLGRLIRTATAPGHYGYSQVSKTSEVLQALTAYRARLQRSQASEDRIKATAPPRRRPSGARSFRDLPKSA